MKLRKAFYIPEEILKKLDEIYLRRYNKTKDSFSDLVVEALNLLIKKEMKNNERIDQCRDEVKSLND